MSSPSELGLIQTTLKTALLPLTTGALPPVPHAESEKECHLSMGCLNHSIQHLDLQTGELRTREEK